MYVYQNATTRHRDSVRALLFIILLTGGAAMRLLAVHTAQCHSDPFCLKAHFFHGCRIRRSSDIPAILLILEPSVSSVGSFACALPDCLQVKWVSIKLCSTKWAYCSIDMEVLLKDSWSTNGGKGPA